MNIETIRRAIAGGKAVLGIELGSTRIKAVLIGEDHAPIASGNYDWETGWKTESDQSLDDVWTGLQSCYRALAEDVRERATAWSLRPPARSASAP